MKNNLSKKYVIKIPKNIFVFLTNRNVITFLGPLGIKSIKLYNKIVVKNEKQQILVTSLAFSQQLSVKKKLIKRFQKTYVTLLKQKINEVTGKMKKRLNLVGIGYRAIILEKKYLHLKLGFSHFVFFKIPNNLKIMCPRPTKILISGNHQQEINNIAFLIKSYKIPDSYKGKGILHDNEKIILKEGKKV